MTVLFPCEYPEKHNFFISAAAYRKKNAVIDFFVKQKISPIATYSDNNYNNTSINGRPKNINNR